jgi:hypothetical protein
MSGRSLRVALTTKGLRSADEISRKDFCFVCGSTELRCDRFQAAFVCPRVCLEVASDVTMQEFRLDGADPHSLEMLRDMIVGEDLVVSEHDFNVFCGLVSALGNVELIETYLESVEKGDRLDVSNCISRLKRRLGYGVSTADEFHFIASHFSEIGPDELDGLDIDVIRNIVSHPQLRLASEDSLFTFIFDRGEAFFELFDLVRFEFLSVSSMNVFLDHISIRELSDRVLHRLFNRLRHRVICDVRDIPSTRFDGCTVRFPDSPWSGLMFTLCEECHGNVHERGLVAITASSTSRNQCWQVVNYDWNDYWYTTNVANSWIQFDFKDRLISVTDYALKSDGNGGHHLLHWALSGSIDGEAWTVIDSQNTQELNGKFITKFFHCSSGFSFPHFYRYLRLTQTGKNSFGNDSFMLANIEFFGVMVEPGKKSFIDNFL